VEAVIQASQRLGQPAYVVGGYVRDALLGRPNHDLDIVTVGSGLELAREVAARIGRPHVSYFKNFGTAHLVYQHLEVEFVGARKESYRADSRKPIVENATLEEDLQRRDFTINALAVEVKNSEQEEIIDLFGGLLDLAGGVIRAPLDPDTTFCDDPLRMLRAIRFASQLEFSIESETLESIKRQSNRLSIISRERIVEEFNKILLSPTPSRGLILLEQCNLLGQFLPEIAVLKGVENVEGQGHKDNFYHTVQVVDNLAEKSDDLWLRWAALLHDVGKTQTKRFERGKGWTFHSHEFVGFKMVPRIFRQLHLPQNEHMRFVQKMVALHMRPIALSDEEVTDSAVRRLLFDAGEDIDKLMTLCEADITSKNPRKVERHLANFQLVRYKLKELEERDAIRNFQPPVTGEMIMSIYGLPPCREVGEIKNAIKDAILDGKIRNELNEALGYMQELATRMGLTKVNHAE
jgi:hypothetical protein